MHSNNPSTSAPVFQKNSSQQSSEVAYNSLGAKGASGSAERVESTSIILFCNAHLCAA